MRRCPQPVTLRRRRGAAMLAATVLGLGGCTSGPVAVATQSTEPSGPVVQSTGLPGGWPTGLAIPEGATVTYSTTDDTSMSVLFDAPQDLATLRAFFDGAVTDLGYRRKSDESFVDMLSASWTDGATTISVTATPVADRTSGLLHVQTSR